MSKVIKTFRIETEVAKQLEKDGAKIGLDFSSYLRTILYNHINNFKNKSIGK